MNLSYVMNKNCGIKSLRFPILNEIIPQRSIRANFSGEKNKISKIRVDLEPRKILSFPKLQTTPLDPLSDDREATMDRIRWER